MRDALSVLDQVIAFSDSKINFKDVEKILGIVSSEVYFRFTDSIKDKNSKLLLDTVTEIRTSGIPIDDVVKGLNVHIRNLMYASLDEGINILEMSDDLKKEYIESSKLWDIRDLLRISEVINDLEVNVKKSNQPYIMFELTSLKLLEMDQTVLIEDLLNQSVVSDTSQKKNEVINSKIDNDIDQDEKVEKKESVKLKDDHEVNLNSNKENEVIEDSIAVDIDDIKNNWSEIISMVTNVRTSIGIVMEHSKPIEIKKNILSVGIHNQPKFSLDLLKNNKEIVEDIINKIMNKKVVLKFSEVNDENKSIKIDTDSAKHVKNEDNNSDTMDSVIELFDGEILR